MSCADECRRLKTQIEILRRQLTRRETQVQDLRQGLKQFKFSGDPVLIDIALTIGADMDENTDELNIALADEARKWVGVREEGGDNRGPEVEMFQKAVDGIAQGESWCAGFGIYCVAEVERRHNVKSRIHRSERVLDIWEKSPEDMRSMVPGAGYFACWIHGLGPKGHLEIVQNDITKENFKTVGGNTGDGSGINREGDGVYERLRSLSPQGKMRLLGFIKVF